MSDGNTASESSKPGWRLALARRMPELLYGAVVSASILAVSSLHGPTTKRVAIATLVVVATYWLAHVYVDAIGGRFEDPDHTTHSRLGHAVLNNTAILIFTVCRLLGLGVPASAWLALWFTVALLTGAGAFAAHQAGARGIALL